MDKRKENTMDFSKTEQIIKNNLYTIRDNSKKGKEEFFDETEIKDYKKTITSKTGKIKYITNLETINKSTVPAAILPVYAKFADCSIDDLFTDLETGENPLSLNPVLDLAHIVAFSAYSACLFLEALYQAGLIDIDTDKDGEARIRIIGKESGFCWKSPSLLDDHFSGSSMEDQSDYIHKILERGSIIKDFLKKLKENTDNVSKFKGIDPDLVYSFHSYLTEDLLRKVKEKEKKL